MPKHIIDYVTVYFYRFDTYEWGKLDMQYSAESLIPDASVQDLFPEEYAYHLERYNDPQDGVHSDFYIESTDHYPEDHDIVAFATYKDHQRHQLQM
jgi:hypothetical protein